MVSRASPGVEARRRVAQGEGVAERPARAVDELVADGADDRRLGHRSGHRHPAIGARRVRVPARPDDGVAAAEEEPVAGVLGRLGIVGRLGGVHEPVGQELPAAVVDLVDQLGAALGRVDGAEDEDVGLVLDHAVRVARRLGEVEDPLVARIGGVELALGGAGDPFIGAGAAELGPRRERFGRAEPQFGDAALGRARGDEGQARAGEQPVPHSDPPRLPPRS
jgi:hypothetical protein